MQEVKTYLELSEEAGSSHKFYEAVVSGNELTIRYGRIGDAGQTLTKAFADAAKALAEANKKINEKLKKGYERAVPGVRQKRTVTRRAALVNTVGAARPARNAPKAKQAPVLWKFESGVNAFGVFIDRERCWVGNEMGQIFGLDHQGEVRTKFKLPDGVKCIVADGAWLYAGCDDGNVYDLTGKVPRVAYEIAPNVDIYWLDIFDSVLAVSDDKGGVTTINHEDESQWSKKSKGDSGWMVRCDEIGVYHGHSRGVTMYDWVDGTQLWERQTPAQVLFGWQEESMVYASTAAGRVHSFTKAGVDGAVYQCDSALFSCATAEGGKYVFAGDNNGALYCFNEAGERLWKLASGCGAAYSMQFLDERLYIVTTQGTLACIDASEAAIAAAQTGTVPEAVTIKAPTVEAVSATALEVTRQVGTGVIVECYQEGSRLRVRVVSAGFDASWHCQFPKGIREAGARYVVDEVRESRNGFYRAFGNIRKLGE
jgi:predicted DNA-binding WGR domain protein